MNEHVLQQQGKIISTDTKEKVWIPVAFQFSVCHHLNSGIDSKFFTDHRRNDGDRKPNYLFHFILHSNFIVGGENVPIDVVFTNWAIETNGNDHSPITSSKVSANPFPLF